MILPRLRWLYGTQGASLGLLLPFLLPLLVERGLGAGEIGLVLGASGLVSLMAYPLWGLLADGWLGRRLSIAMAGVAAAAGGATLLAVDDDPLALTAAISLALVGALPWGPLSDALALGSLGDGSAGYGRLRAWASLGWAGSAITAGVVWTILGSAPVFVAFTVLALFVALLALGGVRDRIGEVTRVGETGSAAGGDSGAALHETPVASAGLRATLPLLASPVLLGFLVGLLLASVGEHASWRFVGLRILDQGGGLVLLGLAAALPALVEIPVFTGSRRLVRRLGLRMIFVWGTVISASLTVLIALSSEAWMVTLLRTIDGTSFALRHLGMVLVIGVLLPRSMQAIGQSLGWLMLAGFAPIIADSAGGLIYEEYGGTVLFFTAATLTISGGAIVYFVLRAPRFGRHPDDPAV